MLTGTFDMPNTSRNILLLVTGKSPQIITETVWALACDPENPNKWIPDEIRVVTTTDGIKAIEKGLLGSQQIFKQLLIDYNLPNIKFDSSCLVAIHDKNGEKLSDLKSPKDNEYAADKICSEIQKITAQDNVSLHVSIAGGRKTMGFYAGYALSLYGRAQDSMSHVLVSTEFEFLQGFYYPAPKPNVKVIRKLVEKIEDNAKVSEEIILDTFDAQVWMANIPFVRLRSSLDKKAPVTKSELRFSEVVTLLNQVHNPISVKVCLGSNILYLHGREIKLKPKGLAFYVMFLENMMRGGNAYVIPPKLNRDIPAQRQSTPASQKLAEDFLSTLERLYKVVDARTDNSIRYGMFEQYFLPTKSEINKEIESVLGKEVAENYMILKKGSVLVRGSELGMFNIGVSPDHITFS